MKAFRIILAVILLFYSIPSVLSLLDIHRGTEPDLSSEWIIVTVFIVLSIVFAFTTLLELFKSSK